MFVFLNVDFGWLSRNETGQMKQRAEWMEWGAESVVSSKTDELEVENSS